ncbi:hypothetical protein EZS27_019765 [termite gut metagenome]|uniref:Uncharacterized protein n=1 Tax=termite gut metagenome TaxID=433724 RepID=A0A5J4RC93_9ZZZZ
MTKVWIDETDIAGKKAIEALKNKSFAQVIENEDEEADWWDTISPEEKAAIDRGLKAAAEGRTTPNEEVWKIYAKWL